MRLVFRVTSCFVLFCIAASSSMAATQYSVFAGFPKTAYGAYGVKAEGLPDGRWVVWNGDAVFLQVLPGGDKFEQVASGYAGDPGFIAVSPDGHHVLLGGGYSGKLYVFDVHAPADYVAGSEVATLPHYYGVYLAENLVLLDRSTDDYTTSELVVLDLSSPGTPARRVMLKPALADMTGTQYGASACLAVNMSRTTLYTMSNVYDGWNLVGNELKQISVADIVSSYQTSMPLDWNSDAVSIGVSGSFAGSGPIGVSADGTLFVGGTGGIQRINPATATVLETIAPAGSYDYYGGAYSPYTGVLLPVVADPEDWSMDVVYAPADAFAEMPVMSALGVLALASLLVFAAVRAGKPQES